MLHVRQPNVALTLRIATVGSAVSRCAAYSGGVAHEIASPGQGLGLPSSGPGSMARTGRRAAALAVDWLIAYGLAALGLTAGLLSVQALSTSVLAIWIVVGVVAVRLYGFTPGQYALGLRVASVDSRMHVGLGRAIVRSLLIALVIPALFTDADGRGLQDRLTATAVVVR